MTLQHEARGSVLILVLFTAVLPANSEVGGINMLRLFFFLIKQLSCYLKSDTGIKADMFLGGKFSSL